MHSLLASWAPPDERGGLASIAYSGKFSFQKSKYTGFLMFMCFVILLDTGTSFGSAATMILSGYLIETCGWPSVFYAVGGFSILWFILWATLISSTPADHPRISGDELYYIQHAIGDQVSNVCYC